MAFVLSKAAFHLGSSCIDNIGGAGGAGNKISFDGATDIALSRGSLHRPRFGGTVSAILGRMTGFEG
ncbi:MAG: hypothetical protein AAGK98_05170, partial [Pseudomonadota bacterium]